jgi:phage-related protein
VAAKQKPLYWVGSSKKDLKSFPDEVRHMMGYALYLAQIGEKHPDAKALTGFGGAGVLEVVENHEREAKRGAKTPQHDIDVIRERLKAAEEFHST